MKNSSRATMVIIFTALVSCVRITVNVYFPEKEVKEAYRALERELMTPGSAPEETKQGAQPEAKPESSLKREWIAVAYAEEAGLADRIAEIVKKMPDVVQAYKEMGARIADTDTLRDSGAVGEANTGLLVTREKALDATQQKLVEMENENRQTVIKGMARAIIRINRLPESEENFTQVMPQAVEQFAAIRRDSAKKGWWVQDPSGNWMKK